MPKIVDKKKKAEAISDAALKVFREHGYHKTRMADIAQMAGMGKGTLYEYFKDKGDILRFAFDQYFSVFSEGVLQAMKEKTKPSEKILSLIDFALRHAAEWEDHCAIYVDYFGAARSEERKKLSLSSIYAEMKDILENLIKEAQSANEIDEKFDPGAVAELLLSIYDGIILHGIFVGQRINMDLTRKTAMSLITRGLIIGKSK
ncbi:MAG: TetR/AcrR family transcriptional regulator [Deltaproteobacteria bacterium]|jgi:AcrR family transcriptional regulator